MHLRHLGGSSLDFFGDPRWSLENPDENALHDLRDYGLIRPEYGGRDPQFSISGESLAFYRWFLGQEGTPFAQVETETIRLIDDGGFARRHPRVSHHLGKAFDLLRSGEIDDPIVSEIGAHMRSAIFELVSDIADTGDQEKPITRLQGQLARMDISEREAEVLTTLVGLAQATLSLDQRLTHIRDESDKDKPLRSWDEVRRAAFVTAFVVLELDRAFR
jgi:hypothetical protein